MKVHLKRNSCMLTLEPGERVRNESALFYALRNALRKQHYDAIKKAPGNDGHLFAATYYVRDRAWKWGIYDGDYAIRDAAKDLNAQRTLTLNVIRNMK